MRKLIASAATVLLFTGTAHAAIQEQAVTYKDGDTVMKGYIVFDDAIKAKRPGVIVLHDWWGISRHTRNEARNYAGQGYTALVADMYGDAKTADNPKDAGKLLAAVRSQPAVMRSRFDAAKDILSRHGTVDSSRIGAVGYSLGAGIAIEMARVGSELKGVVAFYTGALGPLVSPAAAGNVKAKVLVLNGGADPGIKPDVVEAFKKEMDAAKVDYRYISYPKAVHAFDNPDATERGKQFNIAHAYDPEVDKQSKSEASKFFSDVFKN